MDKERTSKNRSFISDTFTETPTMNNTCAKPKAQEAPQNDDTPADSRAKPVLKEVAKDTLKMFEVYQMYMNHLVCCFATNVCILAVCFDNMLEVHCKETII